MKKLRYEKPVAADVGALTRIYGSECATGFEAGDGCNNTGNYAQECGFGYNNGVQPICNATGNGAENSCTGDGETPGSCSSGDTPDGTPCIVLGSGAAAYCGSGSGKV